MEFGKAMKRLFVSAALLPLLHATAAQAETKITTTVTAPVRTSTAAAGQPDSVLIDTGGAIKPTASGAALTLDSQHGARNQGVISFNNVDNATGVLLVDGRSGTFTNAGAIDLLEDYTAEDTDKDGDLDGAFTKGTGRYGIRATGATAYTGDVLNQGAINIEGANSAGISLETRLIGKLTSTAGVQVLGDNATGIAAQSVSGDVRITGSVFVRGQGAVGVSLGQVDGGVVLQSAIVATGYRSEQRVSDDAARAKLDADDLKQGGPAVRIAGNVAKGVLLDRPPADTKPDDKDEDKDGVEDTLESAAALSAFGGAPALDIGAQSAITLGAVGAGADAYGLVLRGSVAGAGVQDGVAATGIRVGHVGGGQANIQGGINNQSAAVTAQAFEAGATALLLNATANVPALRNSGTLQAVQNGGRHDARAVADLSGRLSLVENSGVIRGQVVPKSGVTVTGQAVALDLSANTTGATVRQFKVAATDKPAIDGDVLFGSGADRLELAGGTLSGAMSFGAGADTLVLDGAAQAAGRLSDADGLLNVDLRDGRLAVSNIGAVAISGLAVGAKGVLGVNVDAAGATRFDVAGQATFAAGAKVEVALGSLVRGSQSYEVVRAQTLQLNATTASLAGAPYLYQASLRTAGQSVFVDLRPKTATEIGLNRAGAQAFGAVFQALDRNDAIEKAALAQQTRDGFLGLYNQLLPDHSGGALMSAAAISSAISSATSEPMSTGDAGMGVWAQEILFRIDRDAEDASGYRSEGFGLAGGVDLLGETNALGLALAFVGTEYRDRAAAAGEQVSMNLFNGGLYWRMNAGALQADARAGLGYVWFDGDRRLTTSTLNLRTEADWTGWVADAHVGASYELRAGVFFVRPELSLDYLRLSEEGYKEVGGGVGFDLTVEDRKGDLLTGEAALALGARFGDEIYWQPELTVGYRARLAGDPGETTARFGTDAPFVLDPEQAFDGGLVARLGLRGGTESVTYLLDAGGTFEGGYKAYDVRATVRFQF